MGDSWETILAIPIAVRFRIFGRKPGNEFSPEGDSFCCFFFRIRQTSPNPTFSFIPPPPPRLSHSPDTFSLRRGVQVYESHLNLSACPTAKISTYDGQKDKLDVAWRSNVMFCRQIFVVTLGWVRMPERITEFWGEDEIFFFFFKKS